MATRVPSRAFEMRDWQEWIKAVFYAGERGIPRAWGPGRHLFGNNLFSYYHDPEGNTVEYTAEVEQITDPNRKPRIMEPYPDQWRTARVSLRERYGHSHKARPRWLPRTRT